MTKIEEVADALEAARVDWSMELTRLVDGVHTYRLTYADGEVLEFDNTDDLYAHVAAKRRQVQARAAIEAMREPTEAMIESGWQAREPRNNVGRNTILTWNAMIDAAFGETE